MEGCAGRKKGMSKASVSTKEESERERKRRDGGAKARLEGSGREGEQEAGGKQIICGCKGD